jgi:hypothetical protein
MTKRNNQGIVDFEGYSPFEMHNILYDPFGEKSPIKIRQLTESDYTLIPILNQIIFCAKLIKNHGEIKLTNKGFLPTKIVAEIYNQKILTDDFIESKISKLFKESDSMTINLTKILMDLAGLTKKRNNKISLTKLGENLIDDKSQLLKLILSTFCLKFNWAYFDFYGENSIGQLGFGFSLILLNKYGDTKRSDIFYAEKYFKAYPNLIKRIDDETNNRRLKNCYSIRTFDRFLKYFGIIEIEESKKWDVANSIIKTELFDKLIECKVPQLF